MGNRPSDLAETEANYFASASALLMPKGEFVSEYLKCKGDVIDLANHFKVQIMAVNYRVRHLKSQGVIS